MTTALFLLGGFLLLAVFVLVYRIIVLVSIAKGDSEKKASTSNKINALLFPVSFVGMFGLIFWYSGIAKEDLLPEASSLHGVKTDELFWITIAVIMVAFFATHLLLFFFPYKYQYKEGRKALFFPENDKLELVWTVIPALVMTVLVFSGWRVWSDITSPAPDEAVEIEVMGKQFNWQLRYGGKDGKVGRHDFLKIDATNSMGVDFTDPKSLDDFIPGKLILPKGRPVNLKIRSRDVIHSVFLPHFRVKMDAVPGMQTNFCFTPTKTTEEMRVETNNPNFNYEMACTEICGSSHFAMKLAVEVLEPEEFDKWYSEQEPWASKNPDVLAKALGQPEELAQVEEKK
ncbi:cytochrome c oxidase subunit II [Rapidithrix thailandica]|uniref:Cytochrome c oxidase subunit 2 n=1 Tax=Rapidithrix thailandica TaxID=413964 RepID=A0AAW9S3G1_9BACT